MAGPDAAGLPGALVPQWPAPPGVHALFTTRAGGGSQAPFDSLNLGDHVGDAPAAVAAEKARVAKQQQQQQQWQQQQQQQQQQAAGVKSVEVGAQGARM